MADFSVSKRHLNLLATTLSAAAPLQPPPSPSGRWVVVKALPKSVAAAQAHNEELKKWLDTVVTPDAEGKPIYRTVGGQMTFDFQTAEAGEQFKAIMDEQVVLTGVRPITRAELEMWPLTVEQELALVTAGFLEDSESP